ncbi:hypothetical protein GE061_001252 [Apolygus lucorum]|uniref:Uncharacterized protein n=1 Tax=Apolygus lucorum TaxID=248454 RepID=A0A8S9Y6J1_APOLU|nr:hypothetical protein GE061_007423 [Apolygus lucorum]KAF6216902.1 hypothetical protein GE061_001252 [Apolygus lucorum]
MSKGKDLRAMIADVERRLDEETDRDRSPHGESPAEPALPRPRMLPPRNSGGRAGQRDFEREFTVLETGAEMLYSANSAAEREEGWNRHSSALRVLRELTQRRQPTAPRLSVTEIAIAVAQQLPQPRVVVIPTSAEIARDVVALMTEQLPPTLDPRDWADHIVELVTQRQSPAYSPIHDAGAIARAIMNHMKDEVNWELRQPEQPAIAPAAVPTEQAASLPSTSRSVPIASVPSTSMDDLPHSEELADEESHTEDEEPTAITRTCIACGKLRAHNSRLWCEACRTFLRRAKKATADGHPITCKDPRHRHKPEVIACRGCRARHIQTLEAAATRPSEGSDAAEDNGFQRGEECDRRVPPLRLTVRSATPSSIKRARSRSTGSPPVSAPAAAELPPPPPGAPPAAPPLRAHAPSRRPAPTKTEGPP